MKWESFVARRIYLDKEHKHEVSPPAVRLAIAGVALGLAVMILTVAIVVGFKKRFVRKLSGSAHIFVSRPFQAILHTRLLLYSFLTVWRSCWQPMRR